MAGNAFNKKSNKFNCTKEAPRYQDLVTACQTLLAEHNSCAPVKFLKVYYNDLFNHFDKRSLDSFCSNQRAKYIKVLKDQGLEISSDNRNSGVSGQQHSSATVAAPTVQTLDNEDYANYEDNDDNDNDDDDDDDYEYKEEHDIEYEDNESDNIESDFQIEDTTDQVEQGKYDVFYDHSYSI